MNVDLSGAPAEGAGGGDRGAGTSTGMEMLLSIYREEYDRLLRIIKNGPYGLAGAEEDLLQSAMERLLAREARHDTGWKSRSHCRNSLLRTARNLAIDQRRREACRMRVFLYETELQGGKAGSEKEGEFAPDYEELRADTCGDGDPQEMYLCGEERAFLLGLLASLSEEERRLINMREVMDLPWEDVARMVDVSPKVLRMRYSRIKARLRRARFRENGS